jgi:hypothetical protein
MNLMRVEYAMNLMRVEYALNTVGLGTRDYSNPPEADLNTS